MDEKYSMNTELDPEVVKVRDKIISKIGNKPLDEVNSIIKKLLNDQTDEVTRLGLLAARVKIIRAKIESLYERKVEIKPKVVSEPSKKDPVQDQKEEKDKDEKWIRVVMLQSGDVNGKQIDKGVVLDVKEEDGKKLIEAKKAEIVVEKKSEVKEEKEEKKKEKKRRKKKDKEKRRKEKKKKKRKR